MLDQNKLVSITEAARATGISRSKLRLLIGSGHLHAVLLPGIRKIYIPDAELSRYMQSAREAAGGAPASA